MSEPEPDLILARYRSDYYAEAHPNPEDILLIVEVSDSSLKFDRSRKLQLYGAANLAEYWIVNLVNYRLEVYRRPEPTGYSFLQKFYKSDTVSPLAFPDL